MNIEHVTKMLNTQTCSYTTRIIIWTLYIG